ncbi:uncharacterized protein N7458_001091 [Penicillium daleae]|uniref:Uncharacterized protein n=1 Tax=Penicillium daleae TaxID=63821 RepID=A0AAD6CA91_9EURO|nr:uncharacterized protein N7458_001091 [Penicillium daleae]KAJ5459539.1 hypothetical protein N7458_001091 [Penicillium daleae]
MLQLMLGSPHIITSRDTVEPRRRLQQELEAARINWQALTTSRNNTQMLMFAGNFQTSSKHGAILSPW